MKTTLADRMKLAMREAGLTQGSLAKLADVSQPSIWKLTSGKSQGTTKLLEISRSLGVRPEWLGEGIPPMRPAGNGKNYPVYDSVSTYGNDLKGQSNEHVLNIYNRMEWVLSPSVRAQKDTQEMFLLPKTVATQTKASLKDSFAVIAPDDSMSPAISKGATVVLDANDKNIEDGKIFAVSLGELCMLRKLYKETHGKVILRSLNPEDYSEKNVSLNELTILGRVYYVCNIFN